MVKFDRRHLLSSSAFLVAGAANPSRAFAVGMGQSSNPGAPSYAPCDAQLLQYSVECLAEQSAKIHSGTYEAEDLITAAQAIKLAGHHLDDTGVNAALKHVAASVGSEGIDLSYPGIDSGVSYAQRYDPTFTRSDFAPGKVVSSVNATRALTRFRRNGLSGLALDLADALKVKSLSISNFETASSNGKEYTRKPQAHLIESVYHASNHPRLLRVGICSYLPDDFCSNIGNYEDDLAIGFGVMVGICIVVGIATTPETAGVGAVIADACAVAKTQGDNLTILAAFIAYLSKHCCG